MTQPTDAEVIQQLQDKLNESEQRFHGAFGAAAHGMALVSPEGLWLQVNQALCELVGYSEKELLKTDFQTITHPDDLESDLNYVHQLLRGEIQSYHMEKRYFHKSGRVIWVLLSVSLVRDRNNDPLYFVSQIIDITDTKRALLHARKATQVAEQANRAKSEFLARVSHELRTPLNSILGFSRRLKRNAAEKLNERERDALQTVFKNGNNLLNLINDILDLSKIESGNIEVEIKQFSASDLVTSVIGKTEALAHEKGLTIESALPDAPVQIESDYSKLEQILLNLTSNAIKYTEYGKIRLGVISSSDGTGNHSVSFEVSDTGMGIAEEDMKTLFQEFSRSQKVREKNIPGTGLGLSICRQFADILKGKIEVDSVPGQGSTFRVTLPVTGKDTALNTPIGFHQIAEGDPGVICLGSNDSRLKEIYQELLPLGIHPALMTKTSDVMRFCENKIPDLLFLDYGDNEKQYKKTLQRLRSVESLINTHITVCCSSQAEFEKLQKLGADSVMTRPFRAVELSSILRHARPEQN